MGAMGKGLLYQCHITPGFNCLAIADLRLDSCIETAEWLGLPYEVVDTVEAMHAAIGAGKLAIAQDGDLIAQCGPADAVIESTSAIDEGARFSITSLTHGKHLILMNAEIDLIFGPYLMQLARANGVTYASCDGDQHGVLKRVIDNIQLWGFELVMAGNIKGFLNRDANPTNIIPEADKRNLDYKMCTAYTDGTKLCIEMAIIANAFDLKTTVPGMLGPRAADVQEVHTKFDLEALYEDKQPKVDYILGAKPGGGVYVVGYGDNRYQRDMMAYYKMGPGPFYIFYRPYHLCHVEALDGVAMAVLDGKSLLEPTYGFRTNVHSYAKTDLSAGTMLDGIGGYTCYGLIENVSEDEMAAGAGLPICLAEDVKLKRDLAQGERITLDDVEIDWNRLGFDLYKKSIEATVELNN